MSFLKKGKYYYIVSLVVLCSMAILYAFYGVYPFGTGTIACYDDYCQFVPFISLFSDNIWSLQDPFFTYLTGGVSTLPQSMLYCILSPFNIVYLLTPTVNAYYIYNIVHVLKMIAIANVMLWFINKRYSDIKLEYKLAIAIMYAFSSYVIVQNCYTAWLDFMIYMPVLWHNFMCMLDTRRILPFSICICLMICNCYVLGVFALIVMAFIFLVYIFLACPKDTRGKASIDVVVSYIIAILFSAGVLYIAFKGVMLSDRLSSTPISEFMDSWFVDDSLGRVAFLLFDFLVVILAITYLVRCDKTLGYNRFLVAVTVFNILFNLSDTMYLISNGFSYKAFQYRLGFITVFFMFVVAIHYFQNLSTREDTEYAYKSSPLQYVSLLLVGAICVGVFIVAIGYYKDISEYLTQAIADGSILILVGILLAMLLIGLAILKQQLKHKDVSFAVFKISVLIVIITNMCVGNILCVFGQMGGSPAICIDVFQDFKKDYGVLDSDKVITTNLQQNIMLGTTNYNQFNSLIQIPQFIPLLDYKNSDVHVEYNNNLFVDSIMGYKYYYTDVKIDEEYLELKYQDEGFYIYENTLAISGGLVLDNYDFSIDSTDTHCINELYRYLGGSGDVYTTYTLYDIIGGDCPTMQIVSEYVVDGDDIVVKDCSISIEYLSYINSIVYTDRGSCVSSIRQTYMDSYHDYGEICKANELVNIDMYTYTYRVAIEDTKKTIINVLDYDKVYTLLSHLSMPSVDIEYRGRDMVVNTTALSDTQSLILTMPKLDNYTATINGKSVDISTTIGDLMLFDLVAGDNEIIITYHDTSNYTFIMLSVLGITLGLIVYLLKTKFTHLLDKCSTFMMYATFTFVVVYLCVLDISIFMDMLCLVGIL